jgi:hypothetical protein
MIIFVVFIDWLIYWYNTTGWLLSKITFCQSAALWMPRCKVSRPVNSRLWRRIYLSKLAVLQVITAGFYQFPLLFCRPFKVLYFWLNVTSVARAWDQQLTTFWVLSQNCVQGLLALPCLSVRSHGTTRLPLDGFSLNLIFEYFRKSIEEIQV